LRTLKAERSTPSRTGGFYVIVLLSISFSPHITTFYMKKIALSLVFSCTAILLTAQALPKKYVLLEHFTNSRCSICASRNPAFYTLIDQYPNDVHHLSIHPSVPYSNCLIYVANPTQNNARTAVYGVNGTPRVALNGTLVPVASQLLPTATLQAALGQESPIALEVQEAGAAPTKTAAVTVRVYGNVPAGNYKLFAAVAESTVNYASPNGEAKHHDVFRAMLTNIDGDNIPRPTAGPPTSIRCMYWHLYKMRPPKKYSTAVPGLIRYSPISGKPTHPNRCVSSPIPLPTKLPSCFPASRWNASKCTPSAAA
jgi:hypothetical protein